MSTRTQFTRREVNQGLLLTAFATIGRRRDVLPPSLHLFDFAIAGGYFYNLKAAIASLAPGTPLALLREPENPYDVNAIVVEHDGAKLGYVPRAANAPVARLLDRGVRVTADVVQLLDARPARDVPKDLVFTGFLSGDPIVRLMADEAPA